MQVIKQYFHIYMVAVLLGILLWIPFPEVGGAIGASSLVHGFVCFITSTTGMVKGVSLSWVIVFSVSIVWSYVIACRKNSYKPMTLLIGVELIVSGMYILYMVYVDTNSPDINFAIVGFALRMLYWIVLVYKLRKYLKISSVA